VVVLEVLQLYRIGKIRLKRGQKREDVLNHIKNVLFVSIEPYGESHLKTLANLEIIDGHNDPFDHAIISHAITDRYTLISSDGKFKHYIPQKLDFVFNKR
jgi:tRNA(fMet)-specific endonuclease VapC